MGVLGEIDGTGRVHLAAVGAPPVIGDPEINEEIEELEAISRELESHTLAPNTLRAYAKAWVSFESFCIAHSLDTLPTHPESVRWYVAWMSAQVDEWGSARFAISTIRQHLAGIAERHLREGHLDPTGHRGVSDLIRGLAKMRARRPVRKRPLLRADVVRIIAAMDQESYPDGVSATRDAAALWLGFVGALRRSEAASLRADSLELHPIDGIHVRVGASKADQANVLPDLVVLPFGSEPETCAPCALHRWVWLVVSAKPTDGATRQATILGLLTDRRGEHVCGVDGGPGLISTADLSSGAPLLRATYRNRRDARIHEMGVSGDALHSMLRRRMAEAGMDPQPYGFHSLRAGHVTQARRNGASTEEIMRAGRWQRAETVNIYDREHNPIARNSVTRLGL